jgi:signal transduction histidine kinase
MRKQFFRLFFGFVAVVAVFLLIQVAIVFLGGNRQQEEWTDSVFQEYLETFSDRLENEVPPKGWSIANIVQVLVSSADDRVSGLYLRNPDGTVAVAFGKTRRGEELPQNPVGFKMPPPVLLRDGSSYFGSLAPASKMVDQDGFATVKKDSVVYLVEITNDGEETAVRSSRKRDLSEETITLPPEVKASDIAGSLVVSYNGTTICTVDVFTFTPFTYKDTSRVLLGLVGPFVWSIPLAMLISLLMAASISKRGERYTKGIQDALAKLSAGDNGVSLPRTKIDEQVVINESIKQLDETLARNKENRQLWLRSITHDLNTPVSSMKVALDGILDGVFPLTEQTVEMIRKENDELSERIASVILYVNLQGTDAKADFRSFDCQEFAEATIASLPADWHSRVSVKYLSASMQGDERLLGKAAAALLRNALQAGSGTVDWEVGKNRISVSNEGHLPDGVDFFEPWTRGDQGRSSSGSGLGLPIAGQVMRLHDGTASIVQQGRQVVATLRW